MFLLVECDKKFTLGIDWHPSIKGVRLGWIAIHWFNVSFETFMELTNRRYHNRELERLTQEIAADKELASQPVTQLQ